MQVKAIIFDLDGTLADTLDALVLSVNQTLQQFHCPPRSREEIRDIIGNGARNLITRALPAEAAADPQCIEQAFAAYQRNYDNNHLLTDRCYDGIPPLVAALHRQGIALAMLSNKQDRHVRALAAQLFPAGEFSIAMGQTELPRKPDPTVPLMIASRLGVTPEQCAMIGDSEVDIRTAKNAGMRSIGCAWGYRDEQLLIDGGAEVIARHPDELFRILELTT